MTVNMARMAVCLNNVILLSRILIWRVDYFCKDRPFTGIPFVQQAWCLSILIMRKVSGTKLQP